MGCYSCYSFFFSLLCVVGRIKGFGTLDQIFSSLIGITFFWGGTKDHPGELTCEISIY